MNETNVADIAKLQQGINIKVNTHFEASQSDVEAKRFVFSYTIDIENMNDTQVQLLSRRWVVTDGNEKQQEIQGEGVVGEQPIIASSGHFQYSSGSVLETNVGSMYGHYTMVTKEGVTFDAKIAPFTLAIPNALH